MTATDTLSPAIRASKVAKITALLQKTEANGCTAGEVEAARAMAEQLMTKYDIPETECKPVTSRRQIRTESTVSDLFRQMAEEMAQQQRVANARRQYHRRGIHIDDNSQAEGCTCAACRPARAPRPPKADQSSTYSTGRKNHSHAGCDHEATSSARARCRKMRGY